MEKKEIRSIIENMVKHNKISEKTKKHLFDFLATKNEETIDLWEIKKFENFSSWDRIKSPEEFMREFNYFKEHIDLIKISGADILASFDNDVPDELNKMNIELEKYWNVFWDVSNLLKKIINNKPEWYDTKEFNLYIANNIAYRYRVEWLKSAHHKWVFCEKSFDEEIETEEFQKDFNLLYKKLYDIKDKHFIDLFHFFAAYSWYNMWEKSPKDPTKLNLFKKAYKKFAWLITDAEKNGKLEDLPLELRRAYWYTVGWDILESIAYTDWILDTHQLLIDIYALFCLKNSIKDNNFDLAAGIVYLFDLIKNRIDHKNNEFYEVSKEMMDLEISKNRTKVLKFVWEYSTKISSRVIVVYLFFKNLK